MTEPGTLSKVLTGVAARMVADFDMTGALKHSGSKGSARELLLQSSFLERYLPRTVSVLGSGEIIAADGQRSGQCDVLIADPATPPMWTDEHYRLVPAECVDAVIEVKSKLTADELRSAWASVRTAKALPKSAYRPQGIINQSVNLYGRTWECWPTLGYVFAYDSASLESLQDVLVELAHDEPDRALCLDGVFILNRGALLWRNLTNGNVGHSALPQGQGGIQAMTADPGQVLLTMTGLMNSVLSQVLHRQFNVLAYMTETTLGDGSEVKIP